MWVIESTGVEDGMGGSFLMKDEPDIVKELKEEEKLGGLQNKVQNAYEKLELVEEPMQEDIPDKSIGFVEDNVESKVEKDDISCEDSQNKFQSSMDRYRLVFDNVNDVIIYLDRHGKILEVNKRVEDILGRKPEELIGKNFTRTGFFGVKELPKMLKLFKDMVSGREIRLLELEIKHKEGYKIPVEASIRLIKKDGKLEGVIGIIRNVSERKFCEQKIAENTEKYQDLFENSSDLIQAVKPDGSFLYVNRSWKYALGYSEEEIGKLSVFDIIHPDQKDHCMKIFNDIMSGNKIENVETSFVAKDGREIIVEGNVSCRFKDGKPFSTRGIYRDITERKKSEWALRERLKEFKCLYSITDSIRSEKPLDELFVDTTKHVNDAWQYPEITRSRIKLDDKMYECIKFKETKFKQTTDIIIDGNKRGVVEVYYLEDKAERGEGPFLKEEEKLLDEIASHLGTYVEKIERGKKLNEKINQLEQYKRLTVGRELKMAEMKKRIEELERKSS